MHNVKIRAITHAFRIEERKERKRVRRDARNAKRAHGWN